VINCDIKGCGAFESEILGPEKLEHWIRLKACQCGAWDHRTPKSCTCQSYGPLKTSYWPNLDWWALGGVEQITLCPDHKILVMHEIERQRGLDPSMDSEKPNPTNRH
jgi:hypothetical protein